jgi:hypothetical protein
MVAEEADLKYGEGSVEVTGGDEWEATETRGRLGGAAGDASKEKADDAAGAALAEAAGATVAGAEGAVVAAAVLVIGVIALVMRAFVPEAAAASVLHRTLV